MTLWMGNKDNQFKIDKVGRFHEIIMLGGFNEQQLRVAEMTYLRGMLGREIARVLKIDYSKIRLIRELILWRLRKYFAEKGWKCKADVTFDEDGEQDV